MTIVPVGTFSAAGTQTIAAQYASQIPAIAFSIPDIDATATLQLKNLDTGDDVACVTSEVSNGKTVNVPAASYVAAGIAGAALALTGATALGAAAGGASTGGAGATTPSFSTVVSVFQGFAMNGYDITFSIVYFSSIFPN